MAEIRKTNIFQYLKTKYNNVASIVKMNGTQSAGSSDYIARADHVHPTDTSRAASNHSHGSLVNDGALNSDITSVNKVAVTDATNKLKTISKLPLDKVTHQDISGKANVNHTHDISELYDNFDMISGIHDELHEKADKSVVTTSVNGLMSKEDKSKLDGIATEANKTVVDSSLSSSSTNPVQNKVVNSALNGKANSSHTHTASQISDLTVSTHTLANGAKLYKYGKIVMCVLLNVAFSGKKAYTWNDLFTNIPSAYQLYGGADPVYGHASDIMISVQGSTIQIYPNKTSGSVFMTLVWITA